jgi:hypothetical protein
MILTSENDCTSIQKIAISQIKKGEDKRTWISNILDVSLMGTLEYLQKAKIIDKVLSSPCDFFESVHTRKEIKQFCKDFTK